ncbi:alpha/beta hydrolase [Rhodococcus rhodochrous]|uniref:alpha/beta hydrolase n=1 Tax=Rhodococcus rhodochrous TaxID=1829 RepID=UPI001364DBE0|nr:alpha/beta fold hydrolase [Rhodococcus rhodochrous]
MISKSRPIEFVSDGISCAGDLYLPPDFDASTRYPALVVCHGFTVTKRTLTSEGQRFAAAGYMTLAIDYRHFGESSGEPRGRLFPHQEVEDVRSAITWLEKQDNVDESRIGIWGTSFGGGIVTYAAAVDRRVKAVVAQAPILNGYRWLKSMRGADDWESFLDQLEAARRRRAEMGPGEQLADASAADSNGLVALPTSQKIVNAFSAHEKATGEALLHAGGALEIESLEKVIEFDAVHLADRISPRALCVIGLSGYDVYHPREDIQSAFKIAGEPKMLHTVPLDQLDIYWEWGRDVCIPLAVEWFDEHLSASVIPPSGVVAEVEEQLSSRAKTSTTT